MISHLSVLSTGLILKKLLSEMALSPQSLKLLLVHFILFKLLFIENIPLISFTFGENSFISETTELTYTGRFHK